jgi:hypothetical protein
MQPYAPPVSIHRLFAMLVALSMLFAPAFTGAGEAFAATPGHHAQVMEEGHCQMPPANSDDHDKAPIKSCCVAMCLALAITPDVSAAVVGPAPAAAYFAASGSWHGYLGEIATPPPRRA